MYVDWSNNKKCISCLFIEATSMLICYVRFTYAARCVYNWYKLAKKIIPLFYSHKFLQFQEIALRIFFKADESTVWIDNFNIHILKAILNGWRLYITQSNWSFKFYFPLTPEKKYKSWIILPTGLYLGLYQLWRVVLLQCWFKYSRSNSCGINEETPSISSFLRPF